MRRSLNTCSAWSIAAGASIQRLALKVLVRTFKSSISTPSSNSTTVSSTSFSPMVLNRPSAAIVSAYFSARIDIG
jgi:hypothetical protein